MKRSVKKILSAMFVGCMLMSTGAMSAGAVNAVPSETRLADVSTMADKELLGRRGFTQYITSESKIIWEDLNLWPLDDRVMLSLKTSSGPTAVTVRIEQKIDGKWIWAGSGTLKIGGSSVEAVLKEPGADVRVFAYRSAGTDGDCKFSINFTH